jgi:hypothetical protein
VILLASMLAIDGKLQREGEVCISLPTGCMICLKH